MTFDTSILQRIGAVVFLTAVLLLSGAPATAGDECLSSKLANELMDCEHCQAVKKLFSHRSIGKVTMEVHELDHGAIIEIEALHPSAVELVHDFVNEIWNAEAHCETTLSEVCTARVHALRKVEIERALTDHGALVVLRSESAEILRWAMADARDTRSFLLAAASR